MFLGERVSFCDPSLVLTDTKEMLRFESDERPIARLLLTTSAYDLCGELPLFISVEMNDGKEGVKALLATLLLLLL